MTFLATRKEAKAKQEVHYFTGNPCKFNHISKRLTSNGCCVACHNEQSNKLYHAQNGKEKQKTFSVKETKRKWREKNKGTVNSWTALRYAKKKQRTPNWLTDLDIEKIKCFYQVAAMYNKEGLEKWAVDHKIPLQGETVSGLHTPCNLRIITQTENSIKSNNWNWETQTA